MQYVQFLPYWPPMNLTSLSFLYVFLPLALGVYHLVPARRRAGALLGISVFYLLLAQPGALMLLLPSVLLDFALARLMAKSTAKSRIRFWCMAASVCKNLFLFFYASLKVGSASAATLFGAGFYAIGALDAMLCFYRSGKVCPASPIPFALYSLFFPRLYMGPLQTWENFAPQIIGIHPDNRLMAAGLNRYLQGALKVSFIGERLGQIYLLLRSLPEGRVTVLSAWTMILSLALYAYYYMSGYSDMAQGVGNMFGISFTGQFYYPYQALDIGDFFDRFLMTFTDFFKRNISAPISERFPGRFYDFLLSILCGLFLGTWFGLRPNSLVFGLFLGLLLGMERCVYPRLVKAVPTLLGRMLTLGAVLTGFAFLAADTLPQSARHLRVSFFLADIPFYNANILYLLTSNWLLLAIACFCALSAGGLALGWLRRLYPRVYRPLSAVGTTLALILFTAAQL